MKTNISLTLLTLLGLLASPSYALENQSCIDELKQCFARTDSRRDQCFKNLGASQECASSEIGKLAQRRGEFSNLLPNGNDAGPSFLGPQLVDRACIANFDNSWSAAVVKGALTKETLSALSSSLERCSRSETSDLMRP